MLCYEARRHGAPLAELEADCPNDLRKFVFGRAGFIVPWHRVFAYQCVSLRLIAEQLLACSPAYAGSGLGLELSVPGDLTEHAPHFTEPVHLFAFPSNDGAQAVIEELQAAFGETHQASVKGRATSFKAAHAPQLFRSSKLFASSKLPPLSEASPIVRLASPPRHWDLHGGGHHSMTCHRIPSHPIPSHPNPSHTIQYHTIPYHTISFHTTSFHTIPYHTIPYHTMPCHAMPYHTIPYHTIPYHSTSYAML